MITQKDLCHRIEAMYPHFGACGVDFKVKYDKQVKAWAVDLHRDKHHLKTYIEDTEIDQCLNGKQCVPLTLQIAQLQENLEKYMHEHSF